MKLLLFFCSLAIAAIILGDVLYPDPKLAAKQVAARASGELTPDQWDERLRTWWNEPACQYRVVPQGDGTFKLYSC